MRYYLIRKNRETGKVWKAICEEKNGKYIVKAGSIISDVELLRCPSFIQQIRKTAKIDKNRVLLEDVEFEHLDHAASFVLATNAWGKREFKKETDIPLEKRLLEFGNFQTKSFIDNTTKETTEEPSTSTDTMSDERWVDSIVEAMQILGGDAYYEDLYPLIRRIRNDNGLSIPLRFDETVRRCIQDHSSDSDGFKGKRDIFVKLGKGHWGLRNDYAEVQTFRTKPLEDQQQTDLVYIQPISFEDEADNLAVSEDGKQLVNIAEAKLKKEHYKYEGRLKASQIRTIKATKGYICEACGMSFAKKYPGIGSDFIECHHKIPYSDMKEGETRNLNIDDFMVLCSNCHKMIHRLPDPADLDQLKEILKNGE